MPQKVIRPWSDTDQKQLQTDAPAAGPAAPPPAAPTMRPWSGPDLPQSRLEPEYHEPYHAYKANPTPQTADALLKAIDPVLNESLRSYAGGEAQTVTLKARAKTMALEAARRYDPARAKLRTHLLSHLRGLRRVTERATAGAYVPEQTRLQTRVVDATTRDLQDELGRDPSDAEVADRARIPLAQVRKARALPGVIASSQFGGGVEVSRPNERAWNTWVESIYHDVGPIDQLILDHSLGLHGRPVLAAHQIAEKAGLSSGAISLRKSKLQNMLDEYSSFMGLTGS